MGTSPTVPLSQQIATGPAPVQVPVNLTLPAAPDPGTTNQFTIDGVVYAQIPKPAVTDFATLPQLCLNAEVENLTTQNQITIAGYMNACNAYQTGESSTPPIAPNLIALAVCERTGDGSVLFGEITGPLAGPPCPPPVILSLPKLAVWGVCVFNPPPGNPLAGHPIYQALMGSNLQNGDQIEGTAGNAGCPITGLWQCCSWNISPNAGLMFLHS